MNSKKCNEWPILELEDIGSKLLAFPTWKCITDTDTTTGREVPKLVKSFVAKNFIAAVDFLNLAAVIAEEANHHPGPAIKTLVFLLQDFF